MEVSTKTELRGETSLGQLHHQCVYIPGPFKTISQLVAKCSHGTVHTPEHGQMCCALGCILEEYSSSFCHCSTDLPSNPSQREVIAGCVQKVRVAVYTRPD